MMHSWIIDDSIAYNLLLFITIPSAHALFIMRTLQEDEHARPGYTHNR